MAWVDVWIVIRGWREISSIRGLRMHMEQSLVGKVLSNCAIRPPMEKPASTRVTGSPTAATSRAAWMPAMPPPTTNTRGWATRSNGRIVAITRTRSFKQIVEFSLGRPGGSPLRG